MKEFVIGAAGIVLAGAALAQAPGVSTPPPPVIQVPQVAPAPPAFREHSRTEVVAKVREHFARMDANRDGFLTKDEAEAGRKVMKERVRSRIGDRRERRVERHAERVARNPDAGFDRIDANKDGSISRAEYASAREQRVERRIVRHDTGAPGAHGAHGAHGAAATAPHHGMAMHRFAGVGGHMFTMADANKDGRVSLQEATDAAVRHFDMADANRDGRITPDERRQMRHQMIEKRRAPKAG